jgi:hypothetical protein
MQVMLKGCYVFERRTDRNVVVFEPYLAQKFPTDEAVNKILRLLLETSRIPTKAVRWVPVFPPTKFLFLQQEPVQQYSKRNRCSFGLESARFLGMMSRNLIFHDRQIPTRPDP